MMLYTLITMLVYLVNIFSTAVLVQVVLGLLIAFNVVNLHNPAVAAIWKALNAIMEPVLGPIRRIMPDTGAIDLSPMVLLIGLQLLIMFLRGLALSSVGF